MTKRLCVILAVLITTIALGIPTTAQNELRQWATSAEATSEFTSTDWSADRATGPPNAMSVCADSVDAWASLEVTDSETLTLFYDTPVQPTQINIHQNFNPGAITSVELIPAEGDFTVPVANSAGTATECPGIFSLDIEINLEVIGVVINLDQTIVGDWNEIDAVELVGLTDEEVPAGPGSSSPGAGSGGNRPGNNSGDSEPEPTAVPPADDTDDEEEAYVAPDGPSGIDITCPSGLEITNGVEVAVIQMRSGFTYTATALGIDGFDPVIAILDESGRAALCNDDASSARNYSADLPTTGAIAPSSTTAQQTFNNNQSNLSNVSVVVGGYQGAEGEFLIVLEGMAYTQFDNAGDPFAMQITPGMIASGVDPTVYMISVTNRFDPYISMITADYDKLFDDSGNQIWYCDDAGTTLCYGDSITMTGSYVSRTADRFLGGFGLDAMLTLPIGPGDEFAYLNFLMHSSGNQTYGDYLVAFHMGIGNPTNFAGDA